MKPLSILLTFALTSILAAPIASAQATGNSKKSDNQQWLSHQMFQPAPNDDEKQTISEKVIQEIRQLYLEAEKEKASQNQPGAKNHSPCPKPGAN
ncbi:MAG: hypothetical protein ACP5U1_04420 [Desulfomonilaceae bacterium]